jgi:hypothetical protein
MSAHIRGGGGPLDAFQGLAEPAGGGGRAGHPGQRLGLGQGVGQGQGLGSGGGRVPVARDRDVDQGDGVAAAGLNVMPAAAGGDNGDVRPELDGREVGRDVAVRPGPVTGPAQPPQDDIAVAARGEAGERLRVVLAGSQALQVAAGDGPVGLLGGQAVADGVVQALVPGGGTGYR